MNSDQLEGKWKQVKGKFKQKYGDLTDNDLAHSGGKFEDFLGRLQEKTTKRKEQLKRRDRQSIGLPKKIKSHYHNPQNLVGIVFFYGTRNYYKN